MISNERPFKWYIMWQYLEKNYIFPSTQSWRNKVLYLTPYFIFLIFWYYSVLSKIYQHTKSNLMIYNWSMHRKLSFSSSLLKIFSYDRAKENVSYFFCAWSSDHRLWVKNDLQWKTFQMIYNMTLPGKNIFPYLPVMTWWLWYLIFSTFWSHIFLLKIGQYTKSNLMVYNFSMFRKIIFWRPWIMMSLISTTMGKMSEKSSSFPVK